MSGKIRCIKALAACLAFCASIDAYSQMTTVATIGDLQLTNKKVIKDCKVSYRIFGKLNQKKDNAILLPTAFNGNILGWLSFLGEQNYIDTTKYAAIAVDAFGAGQSSSPSMKGLVNKEFPEVSIRDMVNAQYILLKKHLEINSLYAVVGISMGGMQAFEWGSAYPAYVKKVASIEGSPKIAAYDITVWSSMADLLSSHEKYGLPKDQVTLQYARYYFLFASTPEAANDVSPEKLDQVLSNSAKGLAAIPFENAILQLKAMIGHNIAASYNNNMNEVYKVFKAKLFVVVSPDDHAVTMNPALQFAKEVSGETLIINSRCGHQVFNCEKIQIGQALRKFLAQNQ